jgi:hypothetical protein
MPTLKEHPKEDNLSILWIPSVQFHCMLIQWRTERRGEGNSEDRGVWGEGKVEENGGWWQGGRNGKSREQSMTTEFSLQ